MVVVDLMLPNKNGFEIIKEIRRSREIPIIVVSARNDDIDKIRGLDFGADDYLTKPFSPAELGGEDQGPYNKIQTAQRAIRQNRK